MKRETGERKSGVGQLYIIGAGLGDPSTLTVEAREAIEAAAFVVGAERILAPYRNMKRCIAAGRTDDILQALERECTGADAVRTAAVLMSGDSGFFSGAKQLTAALGASHGGTWEAAGGGRYVVAVLPGISSLSYFCARIGRSWEDVKIVNLHGVRENLWLAALTHEKVFAVTGGDVQEQLASLAARGLGGVYACVGEWLSYEGERIRQGTVAQLAEHTYDNPAVLYLENPQTVGKNLTGLPDDSFVRGRTPMTKAEMRAVVMSRLRVREREIVCDIGAGTGSVSVELALAAPGGMVFSVEKDAEAIKLCKLNRERFGLHNMNIIEGTAPEALRALPAPDAAFIGGSGGHLEEIITCLREKNPAVRLVVNAVTLESAQRAVNILESGGFTDVEASQIQVNRFRRVGASHMMAPQNPVTVISARGDGGSAADVGAGTHRGVIIAGTGSGSGKTVLVCGLLAALRGRGADPCAFKCGPDYIDPSFHREVTGAPCYNLDPFLAGGELLRKLYERHAADHGIAVVEGVMGYYDGMGFTEEASTYSVAKEVGLPVVLTVDCRGIGSSVTACVEGFLRHRQPSYIKGVIFNRLAPSLYERAAQAVRALGLTPLGYLPESEALRLESRHLGLVTAQEIEGFGAQAGRLREAVEATVDVDALLELAGGRDRRNGTEPDSEAGEGGSAKQAYTNTCSDQTEKDESEGSGKEVYITATTETESRKDECDKDKQVYINRNPARVACRIAVARDEAFSFLYEDNLDFLKERGAQIVPFSPLHDSALPDCDALYLSGGYPELYAEELAGNVSMRRDIKDKITCGMPTIAECGGFLYLHERIEAGDGEIKADGTQAGGTFYEMTGVMKSDAVRGRKKGRFGYIEVTLTKDCLLGESGDTFRAHEFHYWDSLADCADLDVYRPGNGLRWQEGCCTDTLYAGFPHLYFYGSPKVGERFLEAAKAYAASHPF